MPHAWDQSRAGVGWSEYSTRLRRDTDDAASRARAGVTGLLGLGVVRLAEVVGAAVDDDGALGMVVSPILEQAGC